MGKNGNESKKQKQTTGKNQKIPAYQQKEQSQTIQKK